MATIFVALYNSFANSMFKVLPASGLFKVILAILSDIEKSISAIEISESQVDFEIGIEFGFGFEFEFD